LDRVALHADLTILATLAFALSRARTVPWPDSAPGQPLAPQKTSFSKLLASSAPWALSAAIGLWPVF
jgi:hypothetical protein